MEALLRASRALRLIAAMLALAALSACGPTTVTPTDGPQTDGSMNDVTMSSAPTYWRDIAPIINANCISCHQTGGIGPFALTTYQEVRAVAPLVATETRARRMPPWPPESAGCRPLQHPRNLSEAQIATIEQWANNGRLEGDRATYVAPPGVEDPLPATGDIVVRPAEPYRSTTNETDDYHCFIMDPGLTETRDVIGLRVTPGNPRIVHHMLLFEVREESLAELQALDDAEPGPGYTCFGTHRIDTRYRMAPAGSSDIADFNTQMIAGWAPGGIPTRLPPNTGIRLRAGSRLVMQVHYNYTSAETRGMTDQTQVDLYLSPQPVVSQALWIPQANQSFSIPAGTPSTDPAATVNNVQRAFAPFRIFGTAPHMHLMGRSIRVDVERPNGNNECLINIPNWNFHWQQTYWFNSPLRAVSSGANVDSFRLSCTYDNTAANQPFVNGVQQQPRTLTWGENTTEEMCLNFFYVAL